MAPNALRMARLRGPDGVFLMVPMDHGASMGPLTGLCPPTGVLDAVAGLATCVTVHKGLVGQVAPFADRLGVMMHLSASTGHGPDPDAKRLVASVEEAVRAGCDGVSIHVNVGSRTEGDQLADAGAVADACSQWGMPLLTMAYPRGPEVDDPRDPHLVAHAARLAAELGADVVKVPYTGDVATFARVVEGAGIPVIVAGGIARELPDLLEELEGARAAGAAGISIGRNVFGAKDPGAVMARIHGVFA